MKKRKRRLEVKEMEGGRGERSKYNSLHFCLYLPTLKQQVVLILDYFLNLFQKTCNRFCFKKCVYVVYREQCYHNNIMHHTLFFLYHSFKKIALPRTSLPCEESTPISYGWWQISSLLHLISGNQLFDTVREKILKTGKGNVSLT